MGHKWSEDCIHVPFGMMLFNDKKMATRTGNIVFLEDVLDKAHGLALEIIETEPEHVQRLQEIAEKMLAGFKSLGFDVGEAETPIIPLVIGEVEKTFSFWKMLFENGVYANPIMTPAVPPDRSLIRTSFMAIHTDSELDQVLEITGNAARNLGII